MNINKYIIDESVARLANRRFITDQDILWAKRTAFLSYMDLGGTLTDFDCLYQWEEIIKGLNLN